MMKKVCMHWDKKLQSKKEIFLEIENNINLLSHLTLLKRFYYSGSKNLKNNVLFSSKDLNVTYLKISFGLVRLGREI